MEILFSIGAAIFAVLAGIFGVKNRTGNSKFRTRGGIHNERSRYTDILSDNKRLERVRERISELGERDDDDIKRVKEIGARIRKRE